MPSPLFAWAVAAAMEATAPAEKPICVEVEAAAVAAADEEANGTAQEGEVFLPASPLRLPFAPMRRFGNAAQKEADGSTLRLRSSRHRPAGQYSSAS